MNNQEGFVETATACRFKYGWGFEVDYKQGKQRGDKKAG